MSFNLDLLAGIISVCAAIAALVYAIVYTSPVFAGMAIIFGLLAWLRFRREG
jgi:hypothetical protein